jgi:hypothetical protein
LDSSVAFDPAFSASDTFIAPIVLKLPVDVNDNGSWRGYGALHEGPARVVMVLNASDYEQREIPDHRA